MSDSSTTDFEPRRSLEPSDSPTMSQANTTYQNESGFRGPATSADLVATPADITDSTDSTSTPPAQRQKGMLREIIETALLALLIFVLVRTFVLNFKVEGRSMLPTMQNGDMLLVNRNAYRDLDLGDFIDWIPGVDEMGGFQIVDWGAPERGDVVVFTPPPPGEDKPYIKRVIGLPGDRVEIRDDTVFVNGVALDEDYIGDYPIRCDGQPRMTYCDVVVPEGHVFVMGDHRDNSQDSREFGPVSEDRIIGKAWMVYWPQSSWEIVDHEDYPELQP